MSEPRSSRRADRNAAAPGRRVGDGSKRRVDIVVALAVALPAVVGLTLAAVGSPDDPLAGSTPPVTTSLTSATLSCPPPIAAHPAPVVAARAPGVAGGPVRVRTAPKSRLSGAKTLKVTGPTAITGTSSTVLDASGTAAPGLVAGRREGQAAAPCTTPAYDQWYAGLGASATNDSIITLANPDAGEAVVDIDLMGLNGPVTADRVHGLAVPANSVRTVDLGRVVPSRAAVAAHVMVTRGRVGVSVRHRYDRLSGAPVVSDYVAPQAEPSATSMLLGVTSPAGLSLYLANPGNNQAEATIRVQGPDSAFVPTGTKPVEVPAHTLVRVSVDSAVPKSAVKGMVGLVVDSDQPLVGDLRGMTNKDLLSVGVSPQITGPTAAVVPDAPTRLLLAGAARSGVVDLAVSDAKGKVLVKKKAVALGAQEAKSLTLPKGAAVVSIDPRNTLMSASLLSSGRDGVAVVPVSDTVVHAEVPAVRPG